MKQLIYRQNFRMHSRRPCLIKKYSIVNLNMLAYLPFHFGM